MSEKPVRGPEDVEAALRAVGAPYQPIEAEGARATEAAQALGAPLGAVVKSLLFLADGEPTLVLVSGDRRADVQRLQQVLGARRVMIASLERVEAVTGYPPGAVPPVGHLQLLPTWIDAALADHATVYISGGAPDLMLALPFSDLVKATGGQIVDITRR